MIAELAVEDSEAGDRSTNVVKVGRGVAGLNTVAQVGSSGATRKALVPR
ncbi:MAG: hypothetical protein NNA22_10255 [Nitrospira sp.]|nr:hypothetical protein [Nitrospira sp.]